VPFTDEVPHPHEQRISAVLCALESTSAYYGLRLDSIPGTARIAEYLLYRAALPVLGRKYRSFNYARAR